MCVKCHLLARILSGAVTTVNARSASVEFLRPRPDGQAPWFAHSACRSRRERQLRAGFQPRRPVSPSRYLGLEVVIAKSFARIHWQDLVNFGILRHTLSERQIDVLLAGGAIDWRRRR
jgi:aconitase family protein (aconitate hydratase)